MLLLSRESKRIAALLLDALPLFAALNGRG
jgi:hypothetical protein